MNRLLLILILIFNFQVLTKADDIGDFEIEGISVGDSLLDYFTKENIKQKIETGFYYPKSNKFVIINLTPNNLETYEDLNFSIKPNDKKFIIYNLKGFSTKTLNECLDIKKDIIEEISKVAPNSSKKDYENDYQKFYGNSKAYITDFELQNGTIRTWCVEWDKTNKDVESNWLDAINVSAGSLEWDNFLKNEAYE